MEQMTLSGGGKELVAKRVGDKTVIRVGNGKKSMGYTLSHDERQELLDFLDDEPPPQKLRDWCEVCEDSPAGTRWLCPNRANHLPV